MQSLAIFHKRTLVLTAAAAAATLILGYCVASGQETLDAFHFSQQANFGRKIAPVPLNLQGKNPDLVYLGSYIVNAQSGCNQCHTCPSYRGTDPYKAGGSGLSPNGPGPINTTNYLAGGTPFQNATITSGNLTPDSSGQPGGLNFGQFKKAMQDGESSHKSNYVLQVMPWPVFRNMSDNDLVAIYQYLSALPPSQPGQCSGSGQALP